MSLNDAMVKVRPLPKVPSRDCSMPDADWQPESWPRRGTARPVRVNVKSDTKTAMARGMFLGKCSGEGDLTLMNNENTVTTCEWQRLSVAGQPRTLINL